MDNSIGAQVQVAQVKFFPPLHEQRRSWALDILRRERVTSVLDVGCGEGVLLQHLTHAPPWRAHSASTPAPAVFEKPDFIHVREMHGLDILQDDLSYAIGVTAPSKHGYGWTRFESLDVSIWEGGLQVPNPAFEGIECVVATEVIEHLPDDVLTSFAPVLLGHYAPRLLLFTTPTYDFNTCFSAPGDQSWGFPDPTGRTERVFRHSDHKFEWTMDECEAWCRAAAEEWGYDFTIDSIGRSTAKDPWGRDGDVRATQTVTFRRREGGEWATRRATNYAEWASSRVEGDPHKRLVTHAYEAHTGAEQVASREEITAAIKNTIQDIGASDVTIFEIWREDTVSTLCGGWLEVLLDIITQDPSFLLHKEGKVADDWKVELPGVELRGKNPWQNQAKRDDAWGETSESTDDDTAESYDEDYEEEYDEDDEEYWGESEDAGWVASEGGGWNADDCDINTLKAWAEWKPAPGWIVEAGWE
ncbi:hypothetical protein BJV78DRAFT_1119955 [Lactifluus subvellereus]|nr:hypothetical protein BJV78DRAFT_1119955 [Lactifluus subvellereus]